MNLGKHTTLSRLLRIALPMVISQASDTVMMFVDRLFVSRLSDAHLAASMSGGLTQFMVSSLFIGTVGYVNAVVAQYYGAERFKKCGEAEFQGILLSLLCYPVMLAISPLMRYFFIFAGQSAEQVQLGYLYFQTLIFGSIFLVMRFSLAGFFLGIGRTTVVMIANIAGMLINLPANYVLIFGKLGFPAMGLRGAAVGTILGNAAIFIILLIFYLRGKNRKEFQTHKSLVFRPKIFKTLIRFGVPAGIEMLLNVTAFNLFVQFMHSYGTRVAAAVTIAFNWDIVSFVPMLGMGHAVTALVGQNVGAKNYNEARRSAFTGLKVSWVYSGTMVIIFIFGARTLSEVFVSGMAGDTAAITALSVIMLRLAAFYLLADASQLVLAGALRGAGDTKWVMRASVILHWIFSIAAVILIKVIQADPVIVWLFFIAFVIGLGITMFLRFRNGKWKEIELISQG
jgi:multidrug resistance protein, MATE family